MGTAVSEGVAIIGVGDHPNGVFAEKSPLDLAMAAISGAVADAGVRRDSIDAIIVQACLADQWFNADLAWSRLVEELGLNGKCRTNFMMNSGGSTASNMMLAVEGLLATGHAETVLIVHVEKLGSGCTPERAQDIFATVGLYEEWEAPFGLNYNAIGGMITQRYLHETGASIEEVAAVVACLREWASLNPGALLQRPVSVEQVLEARMVATPLTSRMCNIVCDGASALILTTAERAKRKGGKTAHVLSVGSLVTHYSLMNCADLTRMGWEEAATQAYEKAGRGPEDVDVAEIYDSYPVIPLLALEGLGFCGRGEAGRFVADGHTRPGGKLPMTTNGGMIGAGHIGAGGGTALLVEAVRQLAGSAGRRQVPDARTAAVTEVGGQYMDAHVIILGRV